jgi:TATA-box binding protein (TBP) (component of TFIID and TFIIIB)
MESTRNNHPSGEVRHAQQPGMRSEMGKTITLKSYGVFFWVDCQAKTTMFHHQQPGMNDGVIKVEEVPRVKQEEEEEKKIVIVKKEEDMDADMKQVVLYGDDGKGSDSCLGLRSPAQLCSSLHSSNFAMKTTSVIGSLNAGLPKLASDAVARRITASETFNNIEFRATDHTFITRSRGSNATVIFYYQTGTVTVMGAKSEAECRRVYKDALRRMRKTKAWPNFPERDPTLVIGSVTGILKLKHERLGMGGIRLEQFAFELEDYVSYDPEMFAGASVDFSHARPSWTATVFANGTILFFVKRESLMERVRDEIVRLVSPHFMPTMKVTTSRADKIWYRTQGCAMPPECGEWHPSSGPPPLILPYNGLTIVTHASLAKANAAAIITPPPIKVKVEEEQDNDF